MIKYTYMLHGAATAVLLIAVAAGTHSAISADVANPTQAKVIHNFPEMTAGDCASLNAAKGSYDSSEFSARRQYCDNYITRSQASPNLIEPDRTVSRPGGVDNNGLAPSAGPGTNSVDAPNARVIRPNAEIDRPDTSVTRPSVGSTGSSRVLNGSGAASGGAGVSGSYNGGGR